jgi:hypothetical protein
MTCSRTRRNGLGPQKGVLIETPFFRFLGGKTGDILDKDVLKPPKTCLVCCQGLIFNARITPQKMVILDRYDVFQDWSNRNTPPNRTTDLSFDRRLFWENPFAHILMMIKDDHQKKVD